MIGFIWVMLFRLGSYLVQIEELQTKLFIYIVFSPLLNALMFSLLKCKCQHFFIRIEICEVNQDIIDGFQ